MFTLIYSAQAAQQFGYNTARTTSGEVVQYTTMTDEVAHGPWEASYKWEDAKVVGKCNSYNDIVSFNRPKYDDWGFVLIKMPLPDF